MGQHPQGGQADKMGGACTLMTSQNEPQLIESQLGLLPERERQTSILFEP